MGFIDQFVASATFDKKKVREFKDLSVWRAIFYVLVFVLTTEIIVIIFNPPDIPLGVIGFPIVFHYIRISLVLIEHFVLLSLLAFAGERYNKTMDLSYKQVWGITAYGISAPIVVKTLLRMTEFMFSGVGFIYWVAIALFGIVVFRGEK